LTDTPTITERENGPLVAKGISRLVGEAGEPIEVKEVMALCRCGHSGNKPFCDGSHKTAGFESRGGKPAGIDRMLSYQGQAVTVFYNPRLCSHAAECGRLASHIFNPAQKPWVQPDNGTLTEVEAVVTACPSGALQMSTPGGAPEVRVAERAEITVERDGPYWVTDVVVETDATALGISERKYVLCRCGMSGNKPYCDGTHRDEGWKSGG